MVTSPHCKSAPLSYLIPSKFVKEAALTKTVVEICSYSASPQLFVTPRTMLRDRNTSSPCIHEEPRSSTARKTLWVNTGWPVADVTVTFNSLDGNARSEGIVIESTRQKFRTKYKAIRTRLFGHQSKSLIYKHVSYINARLLTQSQSHHASKYQIRILSPTSTNQCGPAFWTNQKQRA